MRLHYQAASLPRHAPAIDLFQVGSGQATGITSGSMLHRSLTATVFCRASSDSLAGFMSMPDGSTTFPSSPFALPPAYVSAWEGKMKSAAEVRAAVKSVSSGGWEGWLGG